MPNPVHCVGPSTHTHPPHRYRTEGGSGCGLNSNGVWVEDGEVDPVATCSSIQKSKEATFITYLTFHILFVCIVLFVFVLLNFIRLGSFLL